MRNKLVSNTGPIVALSIVNQLSLLHELFKEVYIPPKVFQEIVSGGTENSGLRNFEEARFIQVAAIDSGLTDEGIS